MRFDRPTPQRAARLGALSLAAAALASACNFDINRLRGRCYPDVCEDVQPDEPVVEDVLEEPAFDAFVPDARDATPPVDRPDVTPDVQPDVQPDVPNCMLPGEIIDLTSVATPLTTSSTGAAPWGYLVHGTTTSTPPRPSVVSPPVTCLRSESSEQVSPERIYRYIVQRGPTLLASTEAPLCRTSFDTVVTILRDCPTAGEIAPGPRVTCNDDSERLISRANCYGPAADAGSRDGGSDASTDADPLSVFDSPKYTSAAVASDLRPGDVVYIVVDGFSDEGGDFRLQVVENAARVGVSASLVTDDRRCRCATATPRGSTFRLQNANGDVSQVSLSRAGQAVQFLVNVPTALNVIGLSARLKLVDQVAGCSSTFDVSLSSGSTSIAQVQSFQLDGTTPRVTSENGGVFVVPFQTFDAVTVPSGTMRRFNVSLRADIPTECMAVTFDPLSPDNEVTLYTQ